MPKAVQPDTVFAGRWTYDYLIAAMNDALTIAIILEAVGLVLLVGDLFVPSHGVMTLGGLACLAGGIYEAFRYNEIAGAIALVAVLVLLPIFASTAVRIWPKTFVGRRFAPPNKAVDRLESPAYGRDLCTLVGQTGVVPDVAPAGRRV